jgi:hypothetical protein
MTTKNILSESLVSLFENEMDRAELVLAAKAILDKLQKMAEDLAKIEADDVLPLLDGIRSQFGQQFADQLNDASTNGLRQALEAVKTSKDQIGSAINNMEGVVTGEGTNDMAQSDTTGATDDQATQPAGDDGMDTGATDGEQSDMASDGDDTNAENNGNGEDDELASGLSDLLGGEEENSDQGPEGRTKKEESVYPSGAVLSEAARKLAEQSNPDMFLAKQTLAFAKAKKITTMESAQTLARYYGIDVDDIVIALREYVETLKMDKLLSENAKVWAKKALTLKLAVKEGKNIGTLEAYLTTDRLKAANALASGKITEAQCVKLAKI